MTDPHVPDGKPTVYRITDARKGITEDVNARQRRYLISMGIRTVCFLLAIITSGWLRWLFVIAALLLPYVAVVAANAGREPTPGLPTTGVDHQPPVLPVGPTSPNGPPGPDQDGPAGPDQDGPAGEPSAGGDTLR